jgi:hypothetical protein
VTARVTDAHWAAAAEAVTGGPSTERDVVARVAQAIADAGAGPAQMRLAVWASTQAEAMASAVAVGLEGRHQLTVVGNRSADSLRGHELDLAVVLPGADSAEVAENLAVCLCVSRGPVIDLRKLPARYFEGRGVDRG